MEQRPLPPTWKPADWESPTRWGSFLDGWYGLIDAVLVAGCLALLVLLAYIAFSTL